MLTKKIKLYSYFGILLLFLIYLFSVNNWISLFFGDTVLQTAKFDAFEKKDPVNFAVDTLDYGNNLKETLTLNGWAFCETDQGNTEKEITLILKAGDRCYAIHPTVTNRKDITDAYSGSKKITGTNHGFKSTASTVNMKNGLYDLYIYCKENDANYGLIKTGVKLEKNGTRLSRYEGVSLQQSSISENVNGKNVQSVIDSVSLSGAGDLQVNGWAFVEGVDSAKQSVYLHLKYEGGKNATYETEKTTRSDVGKAFGSSQYDNSGFKANIPSNELQDGNITIDILVRYKENEYLSPKAYKISRSSIEEDSTNSIKTGNTNTLIDVNAESITKDTKIKHSIDSCSADKLLVVKSLGVYREHKVRRNQDIPDCHFE